MVPGILSKKLIPAAAFTINKTCACIPDVPRIIKSVWHGHCSYPKIEHAKRDGSKSKIPLHPSNLMITELNLSDKFRKNKLTKLAEAKAAKKKEATK